MPWVGSEFHRCLYVQGCFAISGNITEAPSNGILPVGRTGWPYFAWHWCNPERSSSILTEGTFLFHFQSILHPEHVASYRKSAPRAAYCMYSLSKIKHYYRARLRNDLPISGWIPPMSTYTRVLCYLWNYHGDTLNCSLLFARTGWPHLPWRRCSNCMLPDGAFLVLFNWLISGDSLYDHTARRCCLYRAMVQVVYLYGCTIEVAALLVVAEEAALMSPGA